MFDSETHEPLTGSVGHQFSGDPNRSKEVIFTYSRPQSRYIVYIVGSLGVNASGSRFSRPGCKFQESLSSDKTSA